MEQNENDNLNITEADRASVVAVLKEVATHIDLQGLNAAFTKNEHNEVFSEKQKKVLLILNLFHFSKRIEQEFDTISKKEWTWFFQTVGYLHYNPRAFLSEAQFERLNKL